MSTFSINALAQGAIQDSSLGPSKQLIDQSLDTITPAFETLLRSFYESIATEISADVSELNDMLIEQNQIRVEHEIVLGEEQNIIQAIQEISALNSSIDDTEINSKLIYMKQTISDISEFVEKNPSTKIKIGKFVEYYLPTTLKLVNAYKDLDQKVVQGKNITSAKQEIKVSLDTINGAFEKLLDDLYESITLDISAEISVLNTDFAREELTKSKYKINMDED